MKNKKNIIGFIIISLIFYSGLFLLAHNVQAETSQAPTSIVDTSTSSHYYDGSYGLNDFIIQAIRISRMILGFVGSLALIMFIYGGFMFLTSGGSKESITKGQKAIIAATVGLIIVFSSYLIISFVLKSMGLTWSGTISIPAYQGTRL